MCVLSLSLYRNSDFGFERQIDGSCTPAFWFVPSATSRDCITGDSFLNTTGYVWFISTKEKVMKNASRYATIPCGNGSLHTMHFPLNRQIIEINKQVNNNYAHPLKIH